MRIKVQPARGKPFWVKDPEKIKAWEAIASRGNTFGYVPTITKREA